MILILASNMDLDFKGILTMNQGRSQGVFSRTNSENLLVLIELMELILFYVLLKKLKIHNLLQTRKLAGSAGLCSPFGQYRCENSLTLNQRDRQTGVDEEFRTNKHTNRQTNRGGRTILDKQTNRQTNRGGRTISCKQTDKWTRGRTDKRTDTLIIFFLFSFL